MFVVDIRGDQVRLGIEAPRELSVHRNEVYEAIQRHRGVEAKIEPKLLTPLELAERLLCSGDGQAVLVITGGVDFVTHCRALVNQIEDKTGSAILAIGLDAPNLEGTNDNERVA